MASVGVRELKNKLSHFLRQVKKGEAITVTERGESVAVIIPAGDSPSIRIARELTAKGIGSWGGGKPKGASHPVKIKGKPVSQIVLEERR